MIWNKRGNCAVLFTIAKPRIKAMQFYFLQEKKKNQRATNNQVCLREGYGLCLQLAYLYWFVAASNTSLLIFQVHPALVPNKKVRWSFSNCSLKNVVFHVEHEKHLCLFVYDSESR